MGKKKKKSAAPVEDDDALQIISRMLEFSRQLTLEEDDARLAANNGRRRRGVCSRATMDAAIAMNQSVVPALM